MSWCSIAQKLHQHHRGESVTALSLHHFISDSKQVFLGLDQIFPPGQAVKLSLHVRPGLLILL